MHENPPLSGVCQADAAVVGGGWTGLLTASFLASQGWKVVVLTQGDSQGSLPRLAVQSFAPASFRRILACHGMKALEKHVGRRERVVRRLPGWLGPRAEFRDVDFFGYARLPEWVATLNEDVRLAQRLGLLSRISADAGGCPFPVEQSAWTRGLLIDSASLSHALRRTIRQAGGRICGASPALNITPSQVFTADGRVDAGRVLLCTGKPPGLRSRRLLSLLETRTLLSCRLSSPTPLHSIHSAVPNGLSLLPLPAGALALWDAGRIGTREANRQAARMQRTLRQLMPDWTTEAIHARPFVRSLDGLPMVGSLRSPWGRLLFAGGAEDFTDVLIAAQALARLALARPHADDLLLRPDRNLPRRFLRSAIVQMRRMRAYNLMHSAPRCSHCRCRLRWQETPRWWGCPSCGSAFTLLGQRLCTPGLTDAQISPAQRPRW